MSDQLKYGSISSRERGNGRGVGAHNYHPLPIVLAKGEGVFMWDPETAITIFFLHTQP